MTVVIALIPVLSALLAAIFFFIWKLTIEVKTIHTLLDAKYEPMWKWWIRRNDCAKEES